MQAWQEKASAQDFVLQMVMERIFYASDGPLSGQTILGLALIVAGPLAPDSGSCPAPPFPMPTDTRDNLLRKLCQIDPARASRGQDFEERA